MNLEILRSIGKNLLKELPSVRQETKKPIGIGASGDKTYAIDKIAENIIVSYLEETCEALTIVSEEIGIRYLRGGGKKVLIDPIDGSRNAISGIPFYCTSIAIADGDTIGDTILAYVINLVNGEEFWAEKNKGAFLNGMRMVSQQDDEFYLIAYEAQNPQKDIPQIMPLLGKSRKTRCLGATALDISYLASGAISVFVTPSPSRSFDFAAGLLIAKEAGGIYSDVKGNPIDSIEISLKKSTSLLVSGNSNLHNKALNVLKE